LRTIEAAPCQDARDERGSQASPSKGNPGGALAQARNREIDEYRPCGASIFCDMSE
jgi:hypothetical protein